MTHGVDGRASADRLDRADRSGPHGEHVGEAGVLRARESDHRVDVGPAEVLQAVTRDNLGNPLLHEQIGHNTRGVSVAAVGEVGVTVEAIHDPLRDHDRVGAAGALGGLDSGVEVARKVLEGVVRGGGAVDDRARPTRHREILEGGDPEAGDPGEDRGVRELLERAGRGRGLLPGVVETRVAVVHRLEPLVDNAGPVGHDLALALVAGDRGDRRLGRAGTVDTGRAGVRDEPTTPGLSARGDVAGRDPDQEVGEVRARTHDRRAGEVGDEVHRVVARGVSATTGGRLATVSAEDPSADRVSVAAGLAGDGIGALTRPARRDERGSVGSLGRIGAGRLVAETSLDRARDRVAGDPGDQVTRQRAGDGNVTVSHGQSSTIAREAPRLRSQRAEGWRTRVALPVV